jgi:hypothetical protein
MKYIKITILILLLASCQMNGGEKEKVVSPPGYDLSSPEKFLMQEELDEISGIIYGNEPGLIYTLNDEEGKIYSLNLSKANKLRPFKFTKKGDFEDLCFDGQYWYALKSNGKVLRITYAFTDSFIVKEYDYPEKGHEYETIFFDPAMKKTIILCKICPAYIDGKIPSYSLDTSKSAFTYEPFYSPDTLAVKQAMGKQKIDIRPSAAAIHPKTGELYIISSQDRLLIIMKDGIVKSSYKLPKKTFRQPEGLTFAPNGDMYISNEAGESIANILAFRYQLP